jgi:hypothetical protein
VQFSSVSLVSNRLWWREAAGGVFYGSVLGSSRLSPGVVDPSAKDWTLRVIESRFLLVGGLVRLDTWALS